jgi:predicted phosphodiesterase
MMNVRINFFLILLCSHTIAESFSQHMVSAEVTHGPYLQNVSTDGATIMFTTNKLVVPGVMLSTDGDYFQLTQNSSDGLLNVGDNLHKIRIRDLLPGKTYHYRLFACEILDYKPYKCFYGDTLISRTYNFRTYDQNAEVAKFTVFCDTHDTPGKLSRYLDSNDIERQDCYFLNGDIMGHVENEGQVFSSFIDTCVARFATKTPFLYVRGNHETRGKFARHLKNYLDLPNDQYYYAFTLGPVRFLVLDGGEDKPDSSKEYSGLVDFDKYRMEELEWLKKEVGNDDFRQASFRIVIIHMPIIRNKKNWYGMAFLAEHFGPVLEEAGIDLMISGHTHRNAWIASEKSGFGYPVMISSNNNYLEAVVTEEQISIDLRAYDGALSAHYDLERR